jgi:flagellar M-ring protein FliF
VTAAILVDDEIVKTVKGGKATYTHHPRSQEQLDKIQELAKAVIGFDAKRGDTISVQNMSFDANAADADLPAPKWTATVQKTVSDYSSVLRPVSLLVLFLLAYLFVLRPIQKQALGSNQLAQGEQGALGDGGKEGLLGMGSQTGDSTHRAALLKEQTIDLIKQKPVNTARAVQAWLREEPS